MAKGLGFAIKEGSKLAVDLTTAAAALDGFQNAINAGHGEKDMAAVVEQFRQTEYKKPQDIPNWADRPMAEGQLQR